MTTPSAALIAALRQLPGDIIVLGVAGKIGPTLARLAKRAAPDKRVVGVARFSEKGVREKLAGWGIECIEAELLERRRVEALPKLANVVFMAGRQVGPPRPQDPPPAVDAPGAAVVARTLPRPRHRAHSPRPLAPCLNAPP